MQSIKRDLSTGLSASALVFAAALAWGSPFVAVDATAAQAQEQAQPQQTQPQPDQAQPQPNPDQATQDQSSAKTFTGTIQKSGSHFVLKDSSGQIFKLDDAASAKPYVGKSVKVVGQLDEQAMLIHVQSIEGTSA
jgi:hemolysin activation/secretion protein